MTRVTIEWTEHITETRVAEISVADLADLLDIPETDIHQAITDNRLKDLIKDGDCGALDGETTSAEVTRFEVDSITTTAPTTSASTRSRSQRTDMVTTWTIKTADGVTFATIDASHDETGQLTIHHSSRTEPFAGLEFNTDGIILGHWNDDGEWTPLYDVC
jgi:hypothetical protein